MPKDLVIRMNAALSFLLKWGFLLNIFATDASLKFSLPFHANSGTADMGTNLLTWNIVLSWPGVQHYIEQAWIHWHLNHSCLANFLNLCNFTWHSCLYLNQTFKFRREKQTMLDLGGNSLGNIEIIIKSYGLKYPYIFLVKPIKST